MHQASQPTVTVAAELRTEAAIAQMARFEIHGRCDSVMQAKDAYWLDLCMTSRLHDARVSYPDRWAGDRFVLIGDLFLVPPGETLRVRCDGGAMTSLVCRIRPELVTKWADDELTWDGPRLEAVLDIRDRNVRDALSRVIQEVRHPGFASETLLDLALAQVVIELNRYGTTARTASVGKGLASWRLKIIDERAREPGKAPTLTDLAQLCSLSVRHLTRGFRKSRGCSITRYIAERRIENAKQMLIAGSRIKTVAYTLGFATPASFSYAFHRATGIRATDFRQLHEARRN